MHIRNLLILISILIVTFKVNYAQVDCEEVDHSGWTDYLNESSYTWNIDWSGYSFTMFAGLGMSYTQIQSAVQSAVSSSFSAWGGPSGISFSPNSQNPDITIDFGSLGNRGGTAVPGYLSVTFDTQSQFYFNTSDREAGRFYFKLVALHEIGNLFIGGDLHVLYAEDSNSVMVTTYFCREKNTLSTCDASTIGDIYTFSSTIQNSFNDGSDYVNIYNSQNSKTVKSAPYNHDEFKSTWPWDMEAENQNFTENSKT